MCSSFRIKLVCVEFWSWSTLFWKRCWLSGPQIPNVYEVKVKQQANNSFLRCDCLHYERCGIPCTHIMKITKQINETMITVQHWNVFLVHFGLPDLKLSDQLMKVVSMQILHEDLGTLISTACLETALYSKISCNLPCYFCVIHYLMFSRHVNMAENVHGCVHILFRLNQENHHAKNEQYPIFYEGTSKFDCDQAIYVMTCGNSVNRRTTWPLFQLW